MDNNRFISFKLKVTAAVVLSLAMVSTEEFVQPLNLTEIRRARGPSQKMCKHLCNLVKTGYLSKECHYYGTLYVSLPNSKVTKDNCARIFHENHRHFNISLHRPELSVSTQTEGEENIKIWHLLYNEDYNRNFQMAPQQGCTTAKNLEYFLKHCKETFQYDFYWIRPETIYDVPIYRLRKWHSGERWHISTLDHMVRSTSPTTTKNIAIIGKTFTTRKSITTESTTELPNIGEQLSLSSSSVISVGIVLGISQFISIIVIIVLLAALIRSKRDKRSQAERYTSLSPCITNGRPHVPDNSTEYAYIQSLNDNRIPGQTGNKERKDSETASLTYATIEMNTTSSQTACGLSNEGASREISVAYTAPMKSQPRNLSIRTLGSKEDDMTIVENDTYATISSDDDVAANNFYSVEVGIR